MRKVLIACVGNIFLGDDGFGVEVARELAKRTLPAGVCLGEFGIRSYDLAYAMMEDWELIILVDAVPQGGKPGTVYVIEPDLAALNADEMEAPALDAHTMNPVAVLQLVRALGGEVKRMLVVGCEPGPLSDEQGQIGLSGPVQAAVGEAVQTLEELLRQPLAESAAA